MENWSEFIFSDRISFRDKVKQVFEYQFKNNKIYHRYCEALDDVSEKEILGRVQDDISNIPLLPAKAFKDAIITTKPGEKPDLIFKSSGTSAMQRSVHQLADDNLYEQSVLQGFRQFYDLDNVVIWGYTPGYADNPHSSLIYMIQKLIDQDNSGLSRFLPLDKALNESAVAEVNRQGKQLVLFGAAFGLLDLLEMNNVNLPSNSIVIETGGMKTHRREVSREELHQRLANGFGLDSTRIHSEYGMAELLSQSYATGSKWFRSVPWMRVSIRNPNNSAKELPPYSEGLIGIIDLANVHSCSFLLTGDKGIMDKQGRFQVLGRWNPKDLRGCNFLIEDD